MENLVYDSVKKIWYPVIKSETKKDLHIEIELYKKLINFFQVGDFYYYVYNSLETKFEYVHTNFVKMLGYNIKDFSTEKILSYVHPDDIEHVIDFENTVTNFFKQLPVEKIQKYKARYDFRIKKSNNEYIRVLQQAIVIQNTDDGEIIRTLVAHTDITHLKKDNKSSLCFIGTDGEPNYIDVATINSSLKPNKAFLTMREKQIINCIAKGYTSRQTGIDLGITKNTVDTHRKKILNKTECNSIAELIAKSLEKGWI